MVVFKHSRFSVFTVTLRLHKWTCCFCPHVKWSHCVWKIQLSSAQRKKKLERIDRRLQTLCSWGGQTLTTNFKVFWTFTLGSPSMNRVSQSKFWLTLFNLVQRFCVSRHHNLTGPISPQSFRDLIVLSCPNSRGEQGRNRDQPFPLQMGKHTSHGKVGRRAALETGVVGWGSRWAGMQDEICLEEDPRMKHLSLLLFP